MKEFDSSSNVEITISDIREDKEQCINKFVEIINTSKVSFIVNSTTHSNLDDSIILNGIASYNKAEVDLDAWLVYCVLRSNTYIGTYKPIKANCISALINSKCTASTQNI